MAAPSWHGGEPRAATNSPSATNAPSGTPSSVEPFLSRGPDLRFPKSARVLRRSDFRKIYDQGSRISCAYFAAFCLASNEETGPRVGFTVSRAAGSAVVRNRMKRRMREAVRLHLPELPPRWWIVFNPRKPLLEADFAALEREVSKVFARCANS